MGFTNHLIPFSGVFFSLNILLLIIVLVISSFCLISDPETPRRCSFENRNYFFSVFYLFVLASTLQSFSDYFSGDKSFGVKKVFTSESCPSHTLVPWCRSNGTGANSAMLSQSQKYPGLPWHLLTRSPVWKTSKQLSVHWGECFVIPLLTRGNS